MALTWSDATALQEQPIEIGVIARYPFAGIASVAVGAMRAWARETRKRIDRRDRNSCSPGFYGPITLELKNVGEVPISLYTFDRVAQLVFHTVEDQIPGTRSADDIANNVLDTEETDDGQATKTAEYDTEAEKLVDEAQSSSATENGIAAEKPLDESTTADDGKVVAGSARASAANETSARGASGQFSSTFVPDLGHARDDKTRNKIESLVERRRRSGSSD